MTKNKKIKVCRKGKSCGFTCISQEKVCRKILPTYLASSLDNRAEALSQSPSKKTRDFAGYTSAGKELTQKYISDKTLKELRKLRDKDKKLGEEYISLSSKLGKLLPEDENTWRDAAKDLGFNDVDKYTDKASFFNKYVKEKNKLGDKAYKAQRAADEKEEEVYGNLLNQLKGNGLNDFKDGFDRIVPNTILGTIVDEKPIRFLPAVDAKEVVGSLSDVSSLINAGGSQKIVIVSADDRAWAGRSISGYPVLNVGYKPDRATMFHEYGHHVEYNSPEINAAAQEFLRSKSNGNKVYLKDALNQPDYGQELAWDGNFVHPYVGKIYDNGNTEVISMGLEHFSGPKGMAQLLEKDPEHFYLMVGIIESQKWQ